MFNKLFDKLNSAFRFTTKFMLVVRILIALYLLYTIYGVRGIFTPPIESQNIPLIIMVVIFLITAVPILIFSIRDLATGRYIGGALDTENSEDTDSDKEAVSDSDPYDPHNVVYKKKDED